MEITEYQWKDLKEGMSLEQTLLLTPDLIQRFADCSGDHSPIHVSRDEAKKRGHPGRVAHGMLLGAFLSRFVGCLLPGRHSLLLSTQLKFRKPCHEGESVVLKGSIQHLTESTRTVSMAFQFLVGQELRADATALVQLQQ